MWRAGFSFRKHKMLNEEGKKDRSPPNRRGSCEKTVRYSLLLARAREECFSEAFSGGPPFVSNLTLLLDRGG